MASMTKSESSNQNSRAHRALWQFMQPAVPRGAVDGNSTGSVKREDGTLPEICSIRSPPSLPQRDLWMFTKVFVH